MTNSNPNSNPTSAKTIVLIALAYLALMFAIPEDAPGKSQHPLRTDAQLSAIASTLAGRPVTLECLRADAFQAAAPPGADVSDADAYVLETVAPDGDYTLPFTPFIYMRAGFCGTLRTLGYRTEGYWREQLSSSADIYQGHPIDMPDGDALSVLNHEATHIRLQSTDEGQVECVSYQNRWQAIDQFAIPGWLKTRISFGILNHHDGVIAASADYGTVC